MTTNPPPITSQAVRRYEFPEDLAAGPIHGKLTALAQDAGFDCRGNALNNYGPTSTFVLELAPESDSSRNFRAARQSRPALE
jgi:hypothetical protein